MNEVEILNKIMQAFPQGSQGGNVVINIINTSNQQNNNISQSTSILNTNLILENAFCTKNLIKINVKVYFMYNKQTED